MKKELIDFDISQYLDNQEIISEYLSQFFLRSTSEEVERRINS